MHNKLVVGYRFFLKNSIEFFDFIFNISIGKNVQLRENMYLQDSYSSLDQELQKEIYIFLNVVERFNHWSMIRDICTFFLRMRPKIKYVFSKKNSKHLKNDFVVYNNYYENISNSKSKKTKKILEYVTEKILLHLEK